MSLHFKNAKGELCHVSDNERTRCECWTRVMGYFRPIDSFNIGKAQEAKERRMFSEKKFIK